MPFNSNNSSGPEGRQDNPEISRSRKLRESPERYFLTQRLAAKEALFPGSELFKSIQKKALQLVPLPNPSKNAAIGKRNAALLEFRQRALDGRLIPMVRLKNMFLQAERLFKPRGNIEDIDTSELPKYIKELVNQTFDQVTRDEFPQQKTQLAKQIEKTLAVIESLPQKLEAALQFQQKYPQGVPINHPFSGRIPLDGILREETKNSASVESFNEKSWSGYKELGRGSFGTVYQAQTDNQVCALKTVTPQRRAGAKREFDMFAVRRQFLPDELVLPVGLQEVSSENREHPFQKGDWVLEYPVVNGQTIHTTLEKIAKVNPRAGETSSQKLDFKAMRDQQKRKVMALEAVQKLADALSQLHAAGIVHQDVNPLNILLDEVGNAKLIDFGEAAYEGEKMQNIAGSPTYMPSEMFSGEYQISTQGDVYALGVTLARLLSGDNDLFNTRQLVKEVLLENGVSENEIKPEDLREENLQGPLKQQFILKLAQKKQEAAEVRRLNPTSQINMRSKIFKADAQLLYVIEKACAENPAERYQTMQEFADDLKQVLTREQKLLARYQDSYTRQVRSDSSRMNDFKEGVGDVSDSRPKNNHQTQGVDDPFFGASTTRVERGEDDESTDTPPPTATGKHNTERAKGYYGYLNNDQAS